MQVIRGKSHLPGNGCAEHCWVGCLSMYHEGLCKVLSVRSYWLSGECLIHLLAGIFDCSTVRSLIMASSVNVHNVWAPSVKVQNVWLSLGRGMAVVVDPDSPSRFSLGGSSGQQLLEQPVIRKQLAHL